MKRMIQKRFIETERLLRRTFMHSGLSIERAVKLITDAYSIGSGVFVFGNGGSAADAVHIAAELNGRYLKNRPPLKAQALVCDPAVLTSLGNDYGFKYIFSRQLEANAMAGDIAFALSTSGNSPNVVKALRTSHDIGMRSILITGKRGGDAADLADVVIRIPTDFTPHIQSIGQVVYHCICEEVERELIRGIFHEPTAPFAVDSSRTLISPPMKPF